MNDKIKIDDRGVPDKIQVSKIDYIVAYTIKGIKYLQYASCLQLNIDKVLNDLSNGFLEICEPHSDEYVKQNISSFNVYKSIVTYKKPSTDIMSNILNDENVSEDLKNNLQ